MSETARIVNVPRVSADFYRGCVDHFPITQPRAEGTLWEPQELSLAALAIFGGAALQIGCGDGKGLVSMLGPLMRRSRRPLITIPGKLRANFARECAKFKRLGFNIPTNLDVVAHDLISRKSTFLDELKPDFVFIDEAHAFRHRKSARTRRMLRFLADNPTIPNGGDVAFVVGSGTLIAASILDAAHLFHHALGPNSPLPGLKSNGEPSIELEQWAAVLDVDGRPSPTDWLVIKPLVRAFAPELLKAWEHGSGRDKRAIAREAYDRRRRCTPGLITTDSESVGASLVIYTHDAPEPPANVARALAQVEAGIRPDGEEEFADDSAKWRAGQQLSIGVFYRWAWERVGGRDEEWLEARKRWHRLVRRELDNHEAPNYDSEGNVKAFVERDLVRAYETGAPLEKPALAAAYVAWYRVRDRHDVEQLRQHVWLSTWFVEHVVSEAKKVPGAFIWYHSEAAENALKACGVRCYGAGSDEPTTGDFCALSWRRHGTGANIQDRFSTCFYLEFPTSGEMAEQSLARPHRNGQPADEVVAHIYTHTRAFRRNLRTAQARAELLTSTQGRQRLLFAPIVAV
jgi:hypothetical protein